jgi:hypothetical protein
VRLEQDRQRLTHSLTTVLIDDSGCDLRSSECVSGHTIHLLSFHPRAENFNTDACLASPRSAEDALFDAVSSGVSAAAGFAATDGSDKCEAVKHLCLLEIFVQTCHY